ncbi:MAG: hypothetical protein NTW11_00820 [Candidatus Staskawiczbacteria bacterium]|nr:hypothetical protein [Candidatus Staskawiczbacteria bacterium]
MEKKSKRKITKNNKKCQHTLADFLPKDVIEEFIEFKNNPGYKEECEEADEELMGILEDFEGLLGREMTRYEHDKVIAIMRKYGPKDKDGDVFVFLPAETVWEIFCLEREEKWDHWEEFLK